MSKQKVIAAVLGDRGGANAVFPVLERAVGEGHDVHMFLAGTCAAQWSDGALQIPERAVVQSIPYARGLSKPDLLLLGASQSAAGVDAAVRALAAADDAPAVVVQDLYGSALPLFRVLVEEPSYSFLLDDIRAVCVTDGAAWNHLLSEKSLRTELEDKVVVTGGPQFDHVAKMKGDVQAGRRRLRPASDYGEEELIALVCGQLNGTAEVLELLCRGAIRAFLRYDGFSVWFRRHPRQTPLDDALVDRWEEGKEDEMFFVEDVSFPGTSNEDFLPALTPGFVISGYSTTNMIALLSDVDAVYVRTPALFADFAREKYPDVPVMEVPPPVEVLSGAAWYVEAWKDGDGPGSVEWGITDLAAVIRSIRDKDDAWQKRNATRQELICANDGNATERVWQVCRKLLDD